MHDQRRCRSRPTPSTTSSARSSARSVPANPSLGAAAAGREVPGAAADAAAAAAGLDAARADHRRGARRASAPKSRSVKPMPRARGQPMPRRPRRRRRPRHAAARRRPPPQADDRNEQRAARHRRDPRRRGEARLLRVRQAARRAGRRDHGGCRAMHGARAAPRPWRWPKCAATCACRCRSSGWMRRPSTRCCAQAYETGATNAMDAVGGFEDTEDLTHLAQVLPEQTDLLGSRR